MIASQNNHLVDDVDYAIGGVNARSLHVGHLLGGADVHACQEVIRHIHGRPSDCLGLLDHSHIGDQEILRQDVHH
jgi:hypothetical protein